jgi:hypothetical protein
LRSGLFCLIFCLLYALASNAQNKTEVMRVILPKNSINVDHLQLKTLSHSGFSDNLIAAFKDHVYTKNNLLLYYLYSDVSSPKFKRSLEYNQKMNVALLSGDSELKGDTYIVDEAKIITINNIRFSIIKYHGKGIYYLNFTSDYDPKLNFINGFIEYKQADEAEAQQYLSDFLGTIHFNNN